MAEPKIELCVDLRHAAVVRPTLQPTPAPTPERPVDPWWHRLDGLSPGEIRAVAALARVEARSA